MSRRIILLALAVLAVGSLISSAVLSQRSDTRNTRNTQDTRKSHFVQRQNVTTIPPTSSKVETLEIVSTKLINEGTPGAGVAVEVLNNSPKAVMAVDLVCGDGAVTKNGLTDADKPIVVIEPYGRTIIQMSFSEMTYGAPLVVSAVTYSDGGEAGDEQSLRIMHKVRERDKERMKAAKKDQPK